MKKKFEKMHFLNFTFNALSVAMDKYDDEYLEMLKEDFQKYAQMFTCPQSQETTYQSHLPESHKSRYNM